MSRGKPYPLTDADDRAVAVWTYNRTWELMEAEDRTPEQDEEMLATAFASAFHWSRVGTDVNAARSQWQLARVFGLLGRIEESVRHSRRCLELTEKAGLRDFDLAFAYEGMARSLALAGERDEARAFADRATAAAAAVVDEEDRKIVLADLATLPA
jgi:tetratricopeptide (TPR) repeat protein